MGPFVVSRRAGFSLLELMIVIAAIAIVAAIAIPTLSGARKAGNESAAINNLRQLHVAQSIFRNLDKDRDGRLQFAPDLDTLHRNSALFDSRLASGQKQGYAFQIDYADEYSFAATASPIDPTRSGDRYFRIDDVGILRWSLGGAPNAASPPIGD